MKINFLDSGDTRSTASEGSFVDDVTFIPGGVKKKEVSPRGVMENNPFRPFDAAADTALSLGSSMLGYAAGEPAGLVKAGIEAVPKTAPPMTEENLERHREFWGDIKAPYGMVLPLPLPVPHAIDPPQSQRDKSSAQVEETVDQLRRQEAMKEYQRRTEEQSDLPWWKRLRVFGAPRPDAKTPENNIFNVINALDPQLKREQSAVQEGNVLRDKIASTITLQPETPEGQWAVEKFGNVLDTFVMKPAQRLAERTFPNDPLAQDITRIATENAAFLLGIKGLKHGAKGATIPAKAAVGLTRDFTGAFIRQMEKVKNARSIDDYRGNIEAAAGVEDLPGTTLSSETISEAAARAVDDLEKKGTLTRDEAARAADKIRSESEARRAKAQASAAERPDMAQIKPQELPVQPETIKTSERPAEPLPSQKAQRVAAEQQRAEALEARRRAEAPREDPALTRAESEARRAEAQRRAAERPVLPPQRSRLQSEARPDPIAAARAKLEAESIDFGEILPEHTLKDINSFGREAVENLDIKWVKVDGEWLKAERGLQKKLAGRWRARKQAEKKGVSEPERQGENRAVSEEESVASVVEEFSTENAALEELPKEAHVESPVAEAPPRTPNYDRLPEQPSRNWRDYPIPIRDSLAEIYRRGKDEGLIDIIRENPKNPSQAVRRFIEENNDPTKPVGHPDRIDIEYKGEADEVPMLVNAIDLIENLGLGREQYVHNYAIKSFFDNEGNPLPRLTTEDLASEARRRAGFSEDATPRQAGVVEEPSPLEKTIVQDLEDPKRRARLETLIKTQSPEYDLASKKIEASFGNLLKGLGDLLKSDPNEFHTFLGVPPQAGRVLRRLLSSENRARGKGDGSILSRVLRSTYWRGQKTSPKFDEAVGKWYVERDGEKMHFDGPPTADKFVRLKSRHYGEPGYKGVGEEGRGVSMSLSPKLAERFSDQKIVDTTAAKKITALRKQYDQLLEQRELLEQQVPSEYSDIALTINPERKSEVPVEVAALKKQIKENIQQWKAVGEQIRDLSFEEEPAITRVVPLYGAEPEKVILYVGEPKHREILKRAYEKAVKHVTKDRIGPKDLPSYIEKIKKIGEADAKVIRNQKILEGMKDKLTEKKKRLDEELAVSALDNEYLPYRLGEENFHYFKRAVLEDLVNKEIYINAYEDLNPSNPEPFKKFRVGGDGEIDVYIGNDNSMPYSLDEPVNFYRRKDNFSFKKIGSFMDVRKEYLENSSFDFLDTNLDIAKEIKAQLEKHNNRKEQIKVLDEEVKVLEEKIKTAEGRLDKYLKNADQQLERLDKIQEGNFITLSDNAVPYSKLGKNPKESSLIIVANSGGDRLLIARVADVFPEAVNVKSVLDRSIKTEQRNKTSVNYEHIYPISDLEALEFPKNYRQLKTITGPDSFNRVLTDDLESQGFKGILHSPGRYDEFELQMLNPKDVLFVEEPRGLSDPALRRGLKKGEGKFIEEEIEDIKGELELAHSNEDQKSVNYWQDQLDEALKARGVKEGRKRQQLSEWSDYNAQQGVGDKASSALGAIYKSIDFKKLADLLKADPNAFGSNMSNPRLLRHLERRADELGTKVRDLLVKEGVPLRYAIRIEKEAAATAREVPYDPTISGFTPVSQHSTGPIVNQAEREVAIENGEPPPMPLFDGEARVIGDMVRELLPDLRGKGAFNKIFKSFQTADRMFRKYGKPGQRLFQGTLNNAEINGLLRVQFYIKEIESIRKQHRLTPLQEKEVGIVQYSPSERGREMLRESGVEPMTIDKLNPQQRAAYNFFEEMYARFLVDINEARAAAGKKPIKAVDGYASLFVDWSLATDAQFRKFDLEHIKKKANAAGEAPFRHALNPLNFEQEFIQRASTRPAPLAKPGHTLKRAATGTYPIKINPFTNAKAYVNTMGPYIDMTPAVAKVNQFLGKIPQKYLGVEGKAGETRTFKIADFDPEFADAALRYLTDLSLGRNNAPWSSLGGGDKLSRHVMGALKNVAAATLGFSLRAAAIQPTAYANIAAVTSIDSALTGIKKSFSKADRLRIERNVKNLQIAKSSFDATKLDMEELHSDWKLGRARDKINNYGFIPLQVMDYYTRVAAALAAEHEAKFVINPRRKAAGLSEMTSAEIYEFANDMVRETQGSGLKSDRAAIQRNILGKTMTLFQTFTINQANLIYSDLLGFKNSNVSAAMAAERTLKYLALTSAASAVYELVGFNSPMVSPVTIGMELAKDNETKDKVFGVIREIMSDIPALSSLTYGGTAGGALFDMGNDLVKMLSGQLPIGRGTATIGMKLGGVPGTKLIGAAVGPGDAEYKLRRAAGMKPKE